jgi:hypothetical protein
MDQGSHPLRAAWAGGVGARGLAGASVWWRADAEVNAVGGELERRRDVGAGRRRDGVQGGAGVDQ